MIGKEDIANIAAGGEKGEWNGIYFKSNKCEYPETYDSNPNYNKAAGFYAAIWKFVGV